MSTVKYGKKFANVTGPNGVATLVLDPADNTAGAVIRTMSLIVSKVTSRSVV